MVVIKELYMNDMNEDEHRVSMNEIKVLSMLRHPNIIAYLGCFNGITGVNGSGNSSKSDQTKEALDKPQRTLMIVMEYANGKIKIQ